MIRFDLQKMFKVHADSPKRFIWACKIGCLAGVNVPQGGNSPMREAVEKVFREMTGVEEQFCFSGWDGKLDLVELAVAKNEPGITPDPIAEIEWERNRQITDEGFTPAGDVELHGDGQLAQAAACYAMGHGAVWPWQYDGEEMKRTTRRRDLIKAGALIVAELDRIDAVGEA